MMDLGSQKVTHSLTHSLIRLLHISSFLAIFTGYSDGQIKYVLEKQMKSGLPGTMCNYHLKLTRLLTLFGLRHKDQAVYSARYRVILRRHRGSSC